MREICCDVLAIRKCLSFFLGGTGKPLAPVMEAQGVQALVANFRYTKPLVGGKIIDGVHIGQPLSCIMNARDDYHAGVDFAPSVIVSAPVVAFASIGATPRTDHLHFELSHQGRILDPLFLFQ